MPWHRWSTLIDTVSWPPLSIGTFVVILGSSGESRWYQHHPDGLVETDEITMMWDAAIPTARKIGANGLDICFRKKKTNTCLLIDISCPADGNIARKQAEKLTKYSDLRVEVSRMWQCRTLVVPVVSGELGTARRY